MKIAELSRRSGVPTTSIKFYLRRGLLPAGQARAHNQAEYDDRHVERLALIRALREVAQLPLESIAGVTNALDRALAEGWESDANPIELALQATHATRPRDPADEENVELARVHGEVEVLLRDLPWMVPGEAGAYADELARSLIEVRRYLYADYPVAQLLDYARIAWKLSEVEFAGAPGGARVPLKARGDDIAEPTRRAILSSILFERIFVSWRRLANTMRSIRISRGAEVPVAD